ncbi:hypothetical protein DSCW_02520 [Desulfosarcina widdelii]|uniref:Uncharacterized protein n=1 Tax=Desulfosarcina widdelii TaxID=947919 RepID=A0A5K7YWR9_9BACT|nr:hypothetical protein [Desulfosarcina widdelii]BBO72835.1 hypothetical protein DSCW_02520 [Desulfosarcina widdelii]
MAIEITQHDIQPKLAALRSRAAKFLLYFIPDLVIERWLPETAGRYRVVDTLLWWFDGGSQ